MRKFTENQRIGMMERNKQYMKEYNTYKKHSLHLQQIKEAFEKEGYKFNNMTDVDTILILLKESIEEVSFLDDLESDDSNEKEKSPSIFDNSFFKKPF